MDINEKYIQIRGKMVTERNLKLGDEFTVRVVVTDIQDKDNNDSTIDKIYKARLFNE